MKNITVIPSFTGSPIHKKSWSLRINQGRAIYCFTLPLSTWTASCVVDSDHHHHHHCSYDFPSVHMMFFIAQIVTELNSIPPTHIPQQSHLHSLSIFNRFWPWRNWPLTYSLMISSMMQCFPNVGSASQARNVESGCQTATTFSLVWLFIKVHGVMLCSRNLKWFTQMNLSEQYCPFLHRCICHICDIMHVGCLKWSKFCNWCS